MIKKILTLIVFFQVFVSFSQELEKKEKIPLQGPISSQIIKESSSADKRADTPFRQRLVTGGINVKGNMTFIGNNILNRDTDKTRPIRPLYKFNGTWYDVFYGSETANDPYNSDLFFNNGGRPDEINNGNVYMDYIDVDGDASTFSSSKATLALPTCSRIVYAGLYWAGVYPYETWQNQEQRSIDRNKIKFKVPGGNYIDLIANTTDSSIREQIYDDGAVNQKPYVYYKDVTNLIDKDNPNGDYFAANIRGIRGIRSTGGGIGGAAGWTLILIYENEAESSKNISLFDGFATIDGSNDVDVSYTGFTTIPAGPVRAELIVATLEGDGFLEEDRFKIEDNNGDFIDVSNSKNPADNFFNGSITKYGNYAAGRNPSSENTLGFDVDLLTLNNPSNSVIGNGDTSTNIRFTTGGDVYWPFLTAMSVEIIEPKIQLVKTIDDGAGNDVAGASVGLGSELWYEVSFQNIGTDNALNTEIVDRLPKNVDLIEADLVLPDPRITYTYEAPTPANGFRGELRLKIPDDMVEEGGIKHSFRFKVKVVTDCNQLRDVCSNKIENQAYANYDSDEGNTPRITNDLSFSGVDACNLGVIGTSNFLIDTSGCTFERDEILCGSSITLTAGAGFQSYEWKDPNGNVIGTNQTVTVSVPGTYTVNKIAPVGCIDTTEKINVIPYNNEPNPLLPFIDRMLTCPNDLSGLSNVAEIYLCGTGSSRAINLPFTGTTATTVEWFKLDETSCPDAVTGCANVNTACTWQSIGTSFSETITNEGEYRVDVLYDGRCPTSYYFNVFKATLNPDIVKKDIICGKQGSITVNNVPNGYEYKLTGPNGYSVGFQNGNSFTVSDIGDYNLEIRIQNSSAASCIYTYPSINIQNKNIDINLGQSTVLCATDPVDLRIQVSNAPGEYTYVLTEDGNTTPIATFGPTTDNDYTFQVTNAGDYTVQVSTPDCTGTESITINKPLPLTLTAANTKEITCKDGTSDGLITLISGGGTITVGDTYKYAVWTDKGTDLYASISDIPSTAYFTNNVYNVVNGQEGIYRFIVVDSNNCYKVSNPIEIKVEPELTFTAKPKDVTCSGQADGQIEVSLNGGALGYLIEYKEENATTWNTSGVFTGLPANTYTIDVRASKNGYQCLYKIEGIEIKVPNPIVSSASKTKEYTCLENGEITFEEATGGTAPYSYGIQDGATGIMQYTPNRVKGGLTEGIYKLAVKDANNCTLTLADIVIDPLPIKPTFSTNVAYNCDGTGSVTITPAGAGYSYLLDGVAQADPMSNVFTNVAVGLHTIRVDYGSSCTVDISVRVLADKEFSAKVIATTNSICNNSDNGTITVLAEDFVGGDFEYSIDGGATWSMAGDNPYKIVGLQDGVYNVFVKEGGCEIDLGNITIVEPLKLVLSASIEEGASCSGTDTGATIKATAVGGTPPYTYSIDGGVTWNTTGVFTNVPPSATEYEINVRDSRNCNECGCSIDPFINGGFEDPASSTSRPDIRFISEDNFPGWDTTASDNIIEVWSNGYNGVFASEGSSFVELNANRVSTLYQEYCTQPGDIISWSLDHRGRAGVDVADVRIGGSLTTATIVETMSDDKNAWGSYSGTYTVPAGQSVTLVSFEAVSTASGNNTIGNFIDNVNIQINKVSCVPIKIKVDPPATIIHDAKITECYDGSNGQIEVNVTQGGGNYQFRIDGGAWLAPTPSTATTYTFTGLTPKTYTVEVLDGLGCISAPSTHVLHPVLKTSSVLTNVTCDPGEIAITGEGGDGNYVYAVVPVGDPASGFVAGNIFPIAVAGDYDVYVRDNNGNAKYCEYKETVTIGAITSPKASLTAVQPNCTGNTGTINVFISEGAGPYEVTLTGVATGVTATVGPSAATTASFTGLSSDTYEIEVKDANGCKSTKVSEVIAVPDPIVSSASKTKEYTCLENGEITFVQATGGTAPYSYGIQDGATGIMQYSSSRTKGGLTEGVYKLAVRDDNNCILTLAEITIDPLPAEPTFSTGIVYNCDGTGTITVTPTGAGYSYLLDGVAQADPASNVFTNVGVGLHTIRVDYGSSCTIDVSATVLANQEFTAKVDSNTDNRCNGSDDGTITLIASNYGTSYEYSIDGGGTWATATTSPFVIDPVAEGTHAVQVRTTLGTTCVLPLGNVTISEPAPVAMSATIEQIADCVGTGATIQAVSTGGTPPYEYSIDGGTTWNITGKFSNVVASVTPYTIQSKDSKGCVSVTNATITVTAPPGVVHDAEITECYDGNNGQIVVNVTQGNGNYQFRIDGGPWQSPTPSTATTYTFTGLGPKTYTVEVLDGLGCKSLPSTHSLDTEIAVSATKKELSCNPGEITVSGLGGDGNYVYTVVPVGDPATGFSTTTVYPISVIGDYDVYVRDNNGNVGYCEDVTTLTITQIMNPTVSLSDNSPRCFGETGTVTVAIQNGLSPYKIEVVGALGYTNTVTSFTGTNKTYSGLVADAYTVTITDANGCIVTDTINLIQFPELNPTTLGVVPPGCVNYELDNSGFGFDFTNLPTVSAPYSIEYSKDNGTSWQVSPIFRSMNPGTEINPAIRIIDGTGTQVCINYLDRFETPFNVKGLIVNPVSGGGSCLSGFNVTVEAIGGVGPFEFAINAPTGWFAPDAAGPGDPDRTKTFSGLVPGRTYEFFVRDTSTGCIEQNTEDIYAIYTPSVGIEGVVDNMSCSGANSGKITFTLDNTSGDLSDPFDYTLYKRDPSNTGIAVPAYTGINQSGFAPIVVAGLSPGEYYLELTGATGCLWASKDILIEEGTPIQGSVVKANDITCSTAGVVNIENVIGGFGGYDYTLTVTNATGITSPTGGATSIPISYVNVTDPTQPVNVAVEVVDSNGCSQNIGNVDLVVSQLPVIDAIAVSTCDVNKTITVTGANGLAPYLYSIDNGVTYKRIGLFENLVVGTTYTIKIKDANGCESATQTRTIHPSLDFNATVVKNLDCTLTPNATIQLDVLSGTNNYSYIVETSAGANVIPVTTFTTAVTTFSISAVGDYKVTLTDVTSGCSKVKEFTVKDSIKPIFTYDKEDSVCNGSNSGIIRLTAQDNGIVPLRYTISPDPNGVGAITGDVFEKLPPATYVVTAEGSNGCTTTSGNIVIDELTAIDIPAGALKVTEFGCTTGNVTNSATISIDASLITGGSGTYKQVEFIDTKGTATTADDVVLQKGSSYSYTSTAESGGDYLITIYDDKGCSESIATSIAPFAKLLTTKVVVDKKIDCNTGEDITVTYTSSTPVLAPATVSYMVTGTKGYTATNTTGVFTGLVTDTYTVTVTNTGTNCVLTSSHQVLEEPKFVLDINKLSNVNCLGSNTGELSFEFSSSTPYVGNYDYEIFDQGGTLVRPKVLGVNGLVTVTGLSSGSYYVVATMVGSPFCPVQSATIEIEEPDAALNFTTSVKAVSCKDGANGIITVNPVGGWGSYQYELSDALGTTVIKAYNPTNIFKDLSPNTYTVRVKDINGCVVSKTETLVNPDEITFNLVKDDNVCTATSGGSITVTAVGGTGNYTYILVDGSGTEIRNQTTNVFASLGSGTYTVNVKDSNNCSAVSTQNITLHPNLEFTVTETKKIDCTVSPSGIVSVSILSGSGNYEYEVLNSLGGSVVARVAIVGTTVTFNTVAKDIYTINVYDVGATPNCSITKKIDIDDSIKPIFTYDKEDSVCNGSNSGIIRLTAQDNGIVPLRYTISPDPNGVGAITTNVFEKLPPATYVVTAEGSNGCTTTSGNIVIDELTAIDIPAGALKVTEFGCTTGNVTNSATISIDASLITGGSGTYKQVEFIDTKGTATTADDVVLQKGSSYSYTSTAESGGDYLITIYDDKGCSESIAASIAPFAKLLTTKVVVDKKIDCNTGEDITVTYTSSTPVLAPATVSYMVTGTKGYTATNTTGVFTGLVTDTYTVTVTNTGTNCVLTSSHQVLEEPKFVLDINKLSNVNCLGSNTGELSFEFSSSTPYVGNYDYEIFDQGGTLVRPKVLGVNGLVTVTGLSSGSYYVVATMVGSPFCPVQSATIEIEEPDAALKITTTPTLISCIASNTGEVVISAEGGWGGYQYQLLNTTTGVTHQNFATNGTIIGLNAGVYVASVRDANGCIVTDTFTLNAPAPIAETHSVITNVCDGESTATITIDTVSGGQGISPTYTYILVYPDGSQSASQSSNQFTGLPEGDYSVIITDDYSCTYTTPTIKVIDPDKVVASAGITGNITCRDPQATITVTGTGGTAPYMYSNDGINFVASNVFRVDAGQHKYYVRDSKMCVSEAFFVTVAALEELEAELDTTSATVTCNGEANAVLSAIAKGGFGSYEYELLDAADPTNLVVVRPNQTSKVFTNLGPGTYKIRVTSGDCVTLTEAYEIKEPDALEVTGNKTDITCTGEKDGTITVNAVGGTGAYIYALSTDPRKFQKENTFSSLPAGTYTVTVKDERGCFNTIDFEIESPDPLIVSPTALITQQVCIEDATPTFTIEVEGGRAPYFTSIDGGQTFNQGKLTYGAADGIVGGKTYLVYVKDSSGCTPAKPVTVVTTKPVDLNLSVNTVYECDGVTITATVNDEYKNQVVYLLQGNTTLTNDTGVFENVLAGQNYTVTVEHALTGCKNLSSPFEVEDIKPLGMTIDDSEKNILRANGVDGRPPYLYSIDGSNFDANNEFVITQTRDYTITVRDDRGCEFVLTVAGEYITIDVPNLFTPDGDGNNDYWYPNEVESYHDIEVFIYDRYARKITSFKGDHQGWDGTYQGRHLPSGDYWYAIYYKELSGQKKKLMGHFTLYR
ncbi:T9SS type B sorting domain-containing protein [Tenacibaculum maritimum]|uniref:T9SS type B sorting domain-containing protein n=2 Tax=Tenacibaculum maritimum TaxID=107401 RepID=UPI003875CB19